jgi:hypothetical protein
MSRHDTASGTSGTGRVLLTAFSRLLVVSFDLEDLVFYSEFLPLEISDRFQVGCWPADFPIELGFQACMP